MLFSRDAVMDATRISDGTVVVLKRVATDTDEVATSQMLLTLARLKDRKNHAVPLIIYFVDNVDSTKAFLVMPLLRRFYDLPFSTVSEVLCFISQMLEV